MMKIDAEEFVWFPLKYFGGSLWRDNKVFAKPVNLFHRGIRFSWNAEAGFISSYFLEGKVFFVKKIQFPCFHFPAFLPLIISVSVAAERICPHFLRYLSKPQKRFLSPRLVFVQTAGNNHLYTRDYVDVVQTQFVIKALACWIKTFDDDYGDDGDNDGDDGDDGDDDDDDDPDLV